MAGHHKPKAFWRLARLWFRRVRVTVWLLILLLLLSLVYLYNVGFPGFAERMVVRAFAAKGITLGFSRVYLAWPKGIRAEQVTVEPAGSGWLPHIECRSLDLRFSPLALLQLRIVPEQLSIEDGRLTLPYPQTNGVVERLTATNLHARLRFTDEGSWILDSLTGNLEGCELSVSGTIANADRFQDWRILQRRAARSEGSSYEIWKAILEVRDQVRFLSPPNLQLGFDLDGAKPEQAALWFSVRTREAASPWGVFRNPEVVARVQPMQDEACTEVECTLQADRVSGGVVQAEHITFSSLLSCVAESGSLIAGRAALSVARLHTPWAGAVQLEVSTGWSGGATNLLSSIVELDVEAAECSVRQGWARGVSANFRLEPSDGDPRWIAGLSGSPFGPIEPVNLSARVEVDRMHTPWLSATNAHVDVQWVPPLVQVTNLAVTLGGGHLAATAEFDPRSWQLEVQADSDFDPQRLYAALPREAVEWLEQFTWRQPPIVEGVVRVTLPPWQRNDLLWPGDLRPSLYLDGRFRVGTGTFQRIPLSGATSAFTYSNMCWLLPDLTVSRPDGVLHLKHWNNDRTREFLWSVDGVMDPTPAMVLVSENATEAREVLGTLQFGGPPEVHLTTVGCWTNIDHTRAWGAVRATNVAFRGCQFDEVEAKVGFTNLTLTVTEPKVQNADGSAHAASLQFDFQQSLAFLSNGVSRMPPMTIATVIGPDVVQAIAPYRFLSPPDGHVEGVIPLKGVAGANLRFDVSGGPFAWQSFNLQEVEARVVWRGETVQLTNVLAEFYGGRASGEASFDFTGKQDADFWFNVSTEDTDIQPLVVDVFQSTNRLEGKLSGSLSVTNGNTADFNSWFGYGYARLENGYLWNVPVFGIVSPLLDLFIPGLGSSRASEADGRYSITNSVIRTDDLVIHTSNMRLLYAGTVDFEGRVDAVAEAEVLRDAVLVGEIVSAVLTPLSKAMIIEITGTLAQPKARPLYLVPRILVAPLNPVKMFRDMFGRTKPESDATPSDPDSDESSSPKAQ